MTGNGRGTGSGELRIQRDHSVTFCTSIDIKPCHDYILTKQFHFINIVWDCTIMYNLIQWSFFMSLTKNKSMVHRLPLTEARNNLGKVVRRAHMNNETFILEKDGMPIAALINFDDYGDYLDKQDPKLNKQIKQSYSEYLQGKARPVDDFLAELRSEPVKYRKKNSL
jgi:hypothetical protein